jgi:hypothetical protein
MAVVSTRYRAILAATLAAAVGCACGPRTGSDCEACRNRPLRNIACGIYHGTLADEVICCNAGCLSQTGNGCEGPVSPRCGPDCQGCQECCLTPLGLFDSWCKKPQAGPPPETLQPAMPPKFLPVPVEPTVSPVRADAPEQERGDIEVGWRPELRNPSRN